jgi:hypothetical protein
VIRDRGRGSGQNCPFFFPRSRTEAVMGGAAGPAVVGDRGKQRGGEGILTPCSPYAIVARGGGSA